MKKKKEGRRRRKKMKKKEEGRRRRKKMKKKEKEKKKEEEEHNSDTSMVELTPEPRFEKVPRGKHRLYALSTHLSIWFVVGIPSS